MTNKIKYFIGNWKMFGDFRSFKIISKIHHLYSTLSVHKNNNKIVLCVPSTLISFFTNKLKSKFIKIGAQDCHHHEKFGPYTGKVSATMLKSAGAKYIILGHSENRFNGDTNFQIKEKIKSSLNANLNVIFCIVETHKQKKNNKTFTTIKKQIYNSIDKKFNFNRILIAYEPVWSIGSGKIPKLLELSQTIKFIKKEFKKLFKTKKYPIVLYGGSVNDKNINEISSIKEIDGFLIGGASQTSKKFIDIIKNYYK